MAKVTEEQVLEALSAVVDEATGGDVVSLGLVKGLAVREGNVGFAIEVTPEDGAAKEGLRKACEKAVYALPGVLSVAAVLTAERAPGAAPEAPQARPGGQPAEPEPQGIPGVASIIAVASGKGGVGKSTTSVNLALALKARGHRVGLLDADIYGPSIPRMMGLSGQPTSADGNRIDPMEKFGIKCMSIGLLVDDEQAMVWRGPMATRALVQIMQGVEWGELDILVVDLPPGTGDIQLTLVQQVPLLGAVIVSTPQDVALVDAHKAMVMFDKVKVPNLGLVENMSFFLCPSCGEQTDIFGHGGARRKAKELGLDFLGEVPLHITIRETSDAGTPVVATQPDGAEAQAYAAIAEVLDAKIATMTGSGARQAPRIVIE